MNKKGCSRGTTFIFILLLFAWHQINAQRIYPGKYQHHINNNTPLSSSLKEELLYILPPPNIYNEKDDDTLIKPFRFAKSIPVSYSFHSTTIATINTQGDWHWKIKIYSPGALSLSLIFNQWWIPEDSEVYVYNDKEIRGAFKSFPSNKKSGKFATTPLRGDCITLEYFSPAHIKELPQISISKVVYGYRSLPFIQENNGKIEFYVQPQQHIMKHKRRRPKSGKCNVDLSCDTAGMDWSKEADAVAVLLTDENQVYCTGVLLNNAKRDGRQLLLTANHCTGVSNPDTDIIMFNYQRRTCSSNRLSSSSSYFDTLHGLNYLAGSAESDYALFEIQEPIPREYNVYLAGWTTQGDPLPPLVGIHHPSGDFKKLSIYNGHLLPTCWSECPIKDHWKVERWTRGTTEPGSSGSPLFDSNHRVVGQLHGGSASCWNKNGYDVYGSFQASYWQNGLSAYLNPCNETIHHLDGIYFNKINKKQL